MSKVIPIYKWALGVTYPYRECVTVVIPTILRCPKQIFSYSLDQYEKCEVVKEIIIMDNTENKSFDKEYPVTSKIKVLKTPTNTGACVNEGMKLINTDYYLITNDDVACRGRILLGCYGIMEQDPDVGLIQVRQVVNQPLEVYKNLPMYDTSYTLPPNPRATMTGWFQFGRTSGWEEIPRLRYFYGDDLLLDRMRLTGKKVAMLANDHVSHYMSSSVHHTNQISTSHNAINQEREVYLELLRDLEKRINEKNSAK